MSDGDLQTPPVSYQRAPTPGGVTIFGWLEVQQGSPGELILLGFLAAKDSRLANTFVIKRYNTSWWLLKNEQIHIWNTCNGIYLLNFYLKIKLFLSTDTVSFVSENSEIIQFKCKIKKSVKWAKKLNTIPWQEWTNLLSISSDSHCESVDEAEKESPSCTRRLDHFYVSATTFLVTCCMKTERCWDATSW